jgi:hypothetical protein
MSAYGTKRTSQSCRGMSAFGSKAAWSDAPPLGICDVVCEITTCVTKLPGRRMAADQSRSDDNPFVESDDIDDAALTEVLHTVPFGAAVLAGSAVALMVLGYLAIYLLIFLPRGVVG